MTDARAVASIPVTRLRAKRTRRIADVKNSYARIFRFLFARAAVFIETTRSVGRTDYGR
jgi:hypothetical protein